MPTRLAGALALALISMIEPASADQKRPSADAPGMTAARRGRASADRIGVDARPGIRGRLASALPSPSLPGVDQAGRPPLPTAGKKGPDRASAGRRPLEPAAARAALSVIGATARAGGAAFLLRDRPDGPRRPAGRPR